MKKIVAALAAAGLTLGLCLTQTSAGAATPQAAHRSTTAARDVGYTPPPIAWGPCTNPALASRGAQCGFLVVPQDYARPGGAKTRIAVSRLLHKTSTSQGVMLVNPGGPGGSGLVLSVLQAYVPDHAGDAYDWIGFDPRGVGDSSPAISCNSRFFHGDRPPYRPTTRRIHRQWVARSKAYARQCHEARGQALLRHVRTTDTVKDMESLRKALGQQRINYYGFSYGTYLGQVYATLHPNRVRRFVWDGTVNPRRVFYRSNQDQDRAFQKTFTIYFRWLAKYHAVYHVGATVSQVRRGYLRSIARLDRHAAGGVLGGDELTDVFTSAGYYVYGWEDIAKAYSAYRTKGDASGLIALYKDANPTTPGADNGYAMYLGTQCTDAPWPRSQKRLDRDNWRLDRHYDYMTWANAWFNGPCAYWKYAASRPVNVKGSQVHVPVLMIGETFDAATPFSGSLVTRRLFPTARLIEGKNGTTHAGSLSGVACTDNAIAAYLRDGTVPARRPGNRSDKVCPPVPKPNPTARTTGRTIAPGTTDRLPAVLRESLQQAQVRH